MLTLKCPVKLIAACDRVVEKRRKMEPTSAGTYSRAELIREKLSQDPEILQYLLRTK